MNTAFQNIEIPNLESISDAAQNFLAQVDQASVVTLSGDLGAGKTTFVKHLCRALGVEDIVKSPTFSIINEYRTDKSEGIFHMDLYRLKSVEEALDIGIEDYLYSGNWCFIEWPEIVESLLPEQVIQIQIQNIGESARKILFL